MPAPATIVCPACEARFKGKPELGGKKIKCPSCSKPFVVPNEPSPRPKPKANAVEPPADAAVYGLGHVDITHRCPNCAKEMASADAIICIYCGYNTLTRSHGKTKKLIAATPKEHFLYLLPALCVALVFVLIIVYLIFYNTVLPRWVAGSNWDWMTHESSRMWSTITLLGTLWGLGAYAFKTLVVAPKPPEVEAE